MRWNWLPDAVPALLAVATEASFLTVYALGAGALADDPSSAPSLAVFGLAALVGYLAGRLRLSGNARAALLIGLAIGAALLAGMLPGPAGSTATLGVLSLRPGQILLGIAVLRGASHANPSVDERGIERLLVWGTLLLIVPWVAGLAREPSVRAAFVEPAFEATLSFALAGLLGLGTARMRAIGRAAGFDWHTNRAWSAMTATTVLGVAIVAVPAAALLGLPLTSVARGLVGPLSGILALIASFLGLAIGIVYGIAITGARIMADAISSVFGLHPNATTPPEQPSATPSDQLGPSAQIGWAVVFAIVLIAVVAYLAHRWLRARSEHDDDVLLSDERAIVTPPVLMRPGLPSLRFRRGGRGARPDGAVTAYLALLDDWSDRGALAREPAESPRGHAGRLRSEGRGSLSLDLLVADYELARFGGVSLSHREELRAVERWRRLRTRPD